MECVFTLAKNHKCSSTVRLSNRMLCCGHSPRYFRTPSMFFRISHPLMMAVPFVGGIKPEIAAIKTWDAHPSIRLLPWVMCKRLTMAIHQHLSLALEVSDLATACFPGADVQLVSQCYCAKNSNTDLQRSQTYFLKLSAIQYILGPHWYNMQTSLQWFPHKFHCKL